MRKIQIFLQYALGISRVEANGLVIFLPLILIIIFLPGIIRKATYKEVSLKKEAQQLDSLIARIEFEPAPLTTFEYQIKPFDPNRVSAETLQSMGLAASAVRNWMKYLESGGRFDNADDISKVYGLTDSMFNMIKPYAIISMATSKHVSGRKTTDNFSEKVKDNPQRKRNYKRRASINPFDLNLADTLTLKKVKGIGSVLSNRIVKYRKLLGGFVNKAQLEEVYGLNDTVLQRLDTLVFIKSNHALRYLNINIISDKELAKHPYLSNRQARAIIAYRYQHGHFKTTDDLRNIHLLDSLTLIKIAPYLKFSN